MSVLKSIGKGLKKVGKFAGKAWEKIDDFALPAVGFALGGPAGAALGAAAARGIGDGKFNAKATLMAGAKGYAMGGLAQGAGLAGGQGLKALGSSALKAAANPMSTAGNVVKSQLGMGGSGAAAGGAQPSLLNANISADGVIPAAAGAATQGAGRSVLGSIGNAIGGVPGAIDLGMGALAGVQGYQAQKKADAYNKEALAFAKGRDAELAPLRADAIRRLSSLQRPDLSADFASANPFARQLKRVG